MAAGIRRIEAVTGMNALRFTQTQEKLLEEVAAEFKAPVGEVLGKVHDTLADVKALEKELAVLKTKLAQSASANVASQAEEMNGTKLLVVEMKGVETKALRDSIDKLKDTLKSAIIVLLKSDEGKASVAVGVTKDLVGKIKAGEVVAFTAAELGGKGGGRPDFAQGGGNAPENMGKVIADVKKFISEKLA